MKLTATEIRDIDAKLIEFDEVNERYCRMDCGRGRMVQWLKPLTGPHYGFELVLDEPARAGLEAAYQAGRKRQ